VNITKHEGLTSQVTALHWLNIFNFLFSVQGASLGSCWDFYEHCDWRREGAGFGLWLRRAWLCSQLLQYPGSHTRLVRLSPWQPQSPWPKVYMTYVLPRRLRNSLSCTKWQKHPSWPPLASSAQKIRSLLRTCQLDWDLFQV